MSNRKITPPIDRIPIGLVSINGQSFEVKQHPEFVRFFFDLFARVGGTDAMSNTDLQALSDALMLIPTEQVHSTAAVDQMVPAVEQPYVSAPLESPQLAQALSEIDALRKRVEALEIGVQV